MCKIVFSFRKLFMIKSFFSFAIIHIVTILKRLVSGAKVLKIYLSVM